MKEMKKKKKGMTLDLWMLSVQPREEKQIAHRNKRLNKKPFRLMQRLTVQLQANLLQAHSSEQHALPLAVKNHPAHAAHQPRIPQDGGAALAHVVLSFEEVLQPLDCATLALAFFQQEQLSEDGDLPPHPGGRQRAGVLGAAGSRQVPQQVRTTERGGGGVVGPGKDIGALWIHAHVGTGLEKQVQAGFTVRGEDQGLDATPLAQNAGAGEVAEDLALKRRQERFHGGRAAAAVGLRGHAVVVVLDGELGHLALPVAIVEDEQGEAGVAEQAPGLGRVRGAREGQERRLLLVVEVDDQAREGGEHRRHVTSVCAGRER